MEDFKKQLAWLMEQPELSGEDCWSIVCALRGPDITGYITPIKNATTQVIRDWLILQVTNSTRAQNPCRWWIQRNRGRYTFAEVAKQCTSHFANHIYEAEEAIQKIDPKFYIFKKENEDEGSTD